MTIGERIRERRRELGLSLGQLERRSGVYRSTLSRVEHGELANMRWQTFGTIAEALGLSLDELWRQA